MVKTTALKWSGFNKSMQGLSSKKGNKEIEIFLMSQGWINEPTVFIVFRKSGKETVTFETNTWEKAIEIAKKEREKESNWR